MSSVPGQDGVRGPDTAYLLLYVDDIILTASSTSLMQRIISSLHAEFAMTDLGPLNYFLGPQLTLKRSLDMKDHRSLDPTLYCNLTGALQYLTFTRPDLSYAVQQLCLYMHDPREPHLNTMKRVLRCPATRRSTSGYCVFLGDNLLTWSSKCQDMLSRSSAEAEYRRVANVVAETSWIRNLLRELHTPLFTATLVYCDNVSSVYMFANPVQHQRTKQIEIDIHFIRDKVAAGHVRVLHVPLRFHYADIFTKGLPYPLFADFRSSLSVCKSPAPTAEAY
ncbi:ribonuclease H-like domain-containing protein [Tanacetum coccineum]